MHVLVIGTRILCLTAHALDLGTVVVGLFDYDRAGKALNLPQLHELVTLIPTEHPHLSALGRKETNELALRDAF